MAANPTQELISTTKSAYPSAHGPERVGGGRSTPAVPDHELICRIGHGAYGEVWLARNVLGTLRAVKLVYRLNFGEAYPFEREFKGIQKYEPVSRSHDGLVDILQIGRNDEAGYFYCVMELADPVTARPGDAEVIKLEGRPRAERDPNGAAEYIPRTLREELNRRGRLAPSVCIKLGMKLAAALAHLHQAGLVHRDIKPSNIIFVQSAPKLADIGLVADIDEARSYVGTLGFIPPEGPGTPQADIYGLGKVLYEALSGKDRHEFPALPDQFLKNLSTAGGPEANREAELLTGLNRVVLRACESNSRLRYASARSMIEDLDRLQRGEPLRSKPPLQRLWSAAKEAGTALTRLIQPRADTEAQSPVAEANHLFEKGHLCALGATPERLRQASRYFSDAIALDPKFVPAHIGLFRVRLLELTALPNPPSAAVSNLRAAAVQLMAVAPDLAEGRMASSMLKSLEGRLPEALEEARTAARMRSCSRQTHAISHALAGSYLLESGRAEDALEEMRLSERAVPTCAIGQVGLGHPYFVQGKFDLALVQYDRSIELEPRQHLGHYWKGRVYEEMGDFTRAIDAFEQADVRTLQNEASPGGSTAEAGEKIRQFYQHLRAAFETRGADGYWRQRFEAARNSSPADPHGLARVLAKLVRMDEAYQWLQRACEEGKVTGLCFDRCWDRKDLRFRAVAQRVGLGQDDEK